MILVNPIFAPAPATAQTTWSRAYGGRSIDEAYSVLQTSDDGYIVAGGTWSFGAGGGWGTFWVLKLDGDGNTTWQKTYGGVPNEVAYSIQQTSDSGYIVTGWTNSYGAGKGDFWILKLDGDGNVTWQKTYGGTSNDIANSIQQTSDDGYIVAGMTSSFGAGETDSWVLKLDGDGNIIWQKTYGKDGWEGANSILQTSDDGYIIAGGTNSFGAGGGDFWILKLDEDGNVIWQNTYGGSSYDEAYSIQQTSDGGYIVAGSAMSFGAGLEDFWVLKLDEDGNVIWQNTYGGSSYDEAYSIQQTSDDGYIVAGKTNSFGAGNGDFWVLKLDGNGNVTWQKTYGGTSEDVAWSVQQGVDGGYIIAGRTQSLGAGSKDVWVLKLDSEGTIDSLCYSDTNASPADSFVVPVESSALFYSTSATIKNTSVTGNISNCTETLGCEITTTSTTTSTTSTSTSTTTSTTTTTIPKPCNSPRRLTFLLKSGQNDCKRLFVWNCGKRGKAGMLEWQASEPCPWLTLVPASGDSTGEKDTVNVCVDTTGLSRGIHNCTISINSNGGNKTIPVKLTVSR